MIMKQTVKIILIPTCIFYSLFTSNAFIFNKMSITSIYIYILVPKCFPLSPYICNIGSPSKHLKSMLP